MLFQPALCVLVIRTGRAQVRPKARRVVHFPEVHQFVGNHVVPNFGRRLDQAPIQGDRASWRAGTPARSLVSDRNPPHDAAVVGGELCDALGKFVVGQASQQCLDRQSRLHIWANHDALVLQPHDRGFAGGFHAPWNRVPAKKNFCCGDLCASGEKCRCAAPRSLQPTLPARDESLRLRARASSRNGHPHRPLRADREDVALCPWVPVIGDRNTLAGQLDRGRTLGCGALDGWRSLVHERELNVNRSGWASVRLGEYHDEPL